MHFRKFLLGLLILILGNSCNKESFIEGYGTVTDSVGSSALPLFSATINGTDQGTWRQDTNVNRQEFNAITGNQIILWVSKDPVGNYSLSAGLSQIYISYMDSSYSSISGGQGEVIITYSNAPYTSSGTFSGTAYNHTGTKYITYKGSFNNVMW